MPIRNRRKRRWEPKLGITPLKDACREARSMRAFFAICKNFCILNIKSSEMQYLSYRACIKLKRENKHTPSTEGMPTELVR